MGPRYERIPGVWHVEGMGFVREVFRERRWFRWRVGVIPFPDRPAAPGAVVEIRFVRPDQCTPVIGNEILYMSTSTPTRFGPGGWWCP